MCFIISPKYPESKIAEKDIICYKILNRKTSPHQTWFVYKRNWRNEKVDLCPHQIFDEGEEPGSFPKIWINEGYYSYKKFWQYVPKYNDYSQVPRAHFRICKMIIPKGAKYWENETEYVSETIILKRKAFFYSLIYKFF
jgi:hypothetical protein